MFKRRPLIAVGMCSVAAHREVPRLGLSEACRDRPARPSFRPASRTARNVAEGGSLGRVEIRSALAV